MRSTILCLIALCALPTSSFAQGKPQPRPSPLQDPAATSDEKAEEVSRLIEKAKIRQRATDAHNTRIWKRWDFAVCIGCGPMPKGFRVVYTNPARVLAGVLAADDDDRRRTRLPRQPRTNGMQFAMLR